MKSTSSKSNRFSSLFYRLFIEPRSKDEDSHRREYLLNIFLVGSWLIALTALGSILVDAIERPFSYLLEFFPVPFLVFCFFLGLNLLSRKGYHTIAAYLLTFIYYLVGVYCIFMWGIAVPIALFMFVISIIITGILITARAAVVLTVFISLSVWLRIYLQFHGISEPDTAWLQVPSNTIDVVGMVLSLSIISIASWLSSREIERSLERARRSEAALKEERDLLEIKVEERTRDLQREQLSRMSQLYRFAEFGRLASGVLHDLSNPLNSVSLNLSQLQSNEQSRVLKRALEGTAQMQRFIKGAREQLNSQKERTLFSLLEEVQQTLSFFKEKARREKVHITIDIPKQAELFGNPLRFEQVISNLVANALDAFSQLEKDKERTLAIRVTIQKDIRIEVEDNAGGISTANQKKLFQPFFTTKSSDKNSGLGLTIVQDIVEKEFDGSVQVESKEDKGTTFIITIPLHDVASLPAEAAI